MPTYWEGSTSNTNYNNPGNMTYRTSEWAAWDIDAGIATKTVRYREEARAYYDGSGRMTAYQVNRDSLQYMMRDHAA